MPESIAPATAEQWRPAANPWVIAVSVMLATFLEVLDTSVANVALPHMAGNLSVSTEEATWVLTSYLVSNAIVLPLTGWISRHFGRKRFLLSCIILFTLASALCGASTSLAMLVLARVIQGAAGGALQPLSQSIMMESFPPAKRGMAMAAFGLGVVVAPIIGPTLGGWITDNYSWRWIFYINLPIGALAAFMCQSFIEDPPYITAARGGNGQGVDYIGFAFLALWLATLQIILDKGQQDDWFAALWIRWFSGISLVSMIAFIFWELRVDNPIVNLRVLKNRNFAMGTLMITVVGIVLYSTVALLPLFLQNLMDYSALHSGLALSPRGLGAVVSIFLVGRLIGRIDSRILIGTGFCLLAYSSWRFGGLNLFIAKSDIVAPNIIMGLGMGFVFVPMTTLSMGALPNEQMGNAAGIYNLMRNLGGSIGISLVTTTLARAAQVHQNILVAHTGFDDPQFASALSTTAGALSRFSGQVTAAGQSLAALYATVLRQANLMAFMDNFHMLTIVCAFCIPCVLVFRRVRGRAAPGAAH